MVGSRSTSPTAPASSTRSPSDAHPLGARPFARAQYIQKFRTLAEGVLPAAEIDRFLDVVQRLPELKANELGGLNVVTDLSDITNPKGIF